MTTKREIEYHEVTVKFIVAVKSAERSTSIGAKKRSDIRAEMAELIRSAITGNETNCLDAEEMVIVIDGKTELGA